MILVIGGYAAGKKEYVRSLGYQEEDFTTDPQEEKPVVYGLETLAAQVGEGWESLVPGLVEKEVVICQEVGSGVIPLEKEARQMREYTGRLCTALAEQAGRVVRLFCGIPTIIKE